MRARGTLPVVLIALALAALPAAARAQSEAELQRAKDWFQAGAAAYAAGEYLAAIQALEAAYQLTPVPAIAFSLAQAERRQYFVGRARGHLARAIELYRRYLDQVPSGGRRADALEALSQLEPLAAAAGVAGAAPDPAARAAARPTRLLITSEAPGARLALDGAPPAPSPLIREVAPGPHRVEVTAPGFHPERREVIAVAGELIPVAVPLREQPSRLEVSSPATAELYLDGVFVRRGGRQVALALPSGAHRLTVADNGHEVESRLVSLRPGQAQALEVKLRPTRQRRSARALAIGGAFAAGTGALFAVRALRAQDEARDFLARRERGTVDAGQLDEYRDAIGRRDRDRLIAAGSLAVAAGGLGTALVLYLFDRPEPEQLHRPIPGAPAEPRPAVPAVPPAAAVRLDVVPTLTANGLGAALGGRF
jgi:tetratricopeptide (TPR) repeat protein